jgi:uncharacterized protein YndB with AHSA1/START domain
MSSYDKTERGQNSTITFEIDLPHPPAKVWRALTEPALLAKWLLPVAGFRLAPQSEFIFKTEPVGGWDGVVNCRMLEIDAPRTISWQWVVGDIDTIVTFMLAPTAEGTRLTVRHSGFTPDQKQAFGGDRYGWNLMITRLVEVLATDL